MNAKQELVETTALENVSNIFIYNEHSNATVFIQFIDLFIIALMIMLIMKLGCLS